MTGGEQIGQSEIEELLKQANSSKSTDPLPPKRSAAEEAVLAQDDIEALLKQAAGTPERPGLAKPSRPLAGGSAQPNTARSTSDDIQLLIAQAEQALASVDSPTQIDIPGLKSFELRDLTGSPPSAEKATIELLRDVELDLRIELGRTYMYLEDVLKLRRGSVVSLDKLAGDPVDIYVNGRLVARGEVLVLNNNFSVRVAQLVTSVESEVA